MNTERVTERGMPSKCPLPSIPTGTVWSFASLNHPLTPGLPPHSATLTCQALIMRRCSTTTAGFPQRYENRHQIEQPRSSVFRSAIHLVGGIDSKHSINPITSDHALSDHSEHSWSICFASIHATQTADFTSIFSTPSQKTRYPRPRRLRPRIETKQR